MEPHDIELEGQLREALHTAAAPVHGEGVRVEAVRQAVAQRRRNRWRVRTALVALAAAAAVVVVLMAMPDSGERVDTVGRPDRTPSTDVTTATSGDEGREPPDTSSTTEPDTTATSSTTPTPDTGPAATSPTTGGQPTDPPTLTASLSPGVVVPNGRLVYSSVDPCPTVEGVRLHFSYWTDGALDSGQEDAVPLHDGYVEVHESGAWSTVTSAPAEVGRYEIIASCLTDDQDPSDPLPGDPAVIHAEYQVIDFEVVPAS